MSQMSRFFVDIETLTGNTGGPVQPTSGNIDLLGTAPVSVDGTPLTSTLTVSVAGSVATQYDADVGSAVPLLHVLNVNGSHNINTTGAGNTITVIGNNTVTLGDLLPVVGNALTLTTGNETITAGDLNITAGDVNLTLGDVSLTAGNINLPVSNAAGTEGYITQAGTQFMHSLGTDDTFLGANAGGVSITTATANTGIGSISMSTLTTGIDNTAIGYNSLGTIDSGSYNIAVGRDAGVALTLTDSSNILIGSDGILGDNNTIRIGTTGGGAGQQSNCYVAGINAVNVGNVASVVSHSLDHLGSTVITAGTHVTVVPSANKITIDTAGTVATSFPTDAGTAVPAAGALTVAGGTNIGTTGAGSTVTVNLDAALTGLTSITGANGCEIRTGITAGDTLLLRAYDNTGASYATFGTLTANAVPTFDLATTTTIGTQYIYRVGGTDVSVADGGTGASTLTDHGILLGHGVAAVTSQVLTDGQLLIGSTGNDPVAATLTAGANVTITNAAGSITIAAVGLTDVNYTNVNATPYTVLAADEYLSVDTSALAITIKLPDAATSGHVYIIKDRTGAAAARNISVTTVTGAVLIDGAATYTMNTNYQSIQVVGSGTAYEVF